MKIGIIPKVSYKLFFAFLGFAAIVTEVAVLMERGVFNPINFFSFFTIQTNSLVVIVFITSALMAAAKKRAKWLDVLRAAATVYILVVGIGFAVLLSGLDNIVLTAVPWDNIVLHYIIPVAMTIDFLVDKPSRKIKFIPSLLWMIYPVIYLTYSLIRGSITGWYPYPFLNPTLEGYGAVSVIIIGLVLLGLVLIALIAFLTKAKRASI